MGLRDWLFRRKAAEGEWRPGPYMLNDGWLPAGTALNFWQKGENVRPYSAHSAMVEACVSAYSQTVAMCPGDHWRLKSDGGRERVTTSAVCRILRQPNGYQTISDFLLNAVRQLYTEGNAYALAIRNDRAEIAELHLMAPRQCSPMVGEDGSIFYSLGGNEIVDRLFAGRSLIVPARDVLHLRLQTPHHPLRGQSPILAAALDIAAGNAAVQRQIQFFMNEARPSIMLSTDAVLTAQQSKELRDAWEARTRGEGAGGTPILTAGLKPIVVSTSAVDAQLADTLKMSDQAVALAFRMPLQILGIGGTPFASTEMLMQSWIASGLGFVLNHIEEALGLLFGFKKGQPEEYIEFNTSALLRSAFKDRVEGYARGVQGGIFSPNEARAEFELPKAEAGDEPRVQQQVLPLSHFDKLLEQQAEPAEPLPAPPVAEPEQDDTARAAASWLRKCVEEAGGV